jgi:hypothetical protein
VLGLGQAPDLGEDFRPAGLQLESERAPWLTADRRAEQRAAHAGKRVEHQLTRLGEKLDQPGHQPRRFVGAVFLAQLVPELRGIGRRPERLGEVQPLLA